MKEHTQDCALWPGFTSGGKGGSTCIINVIKHMNRLNGRNHMIISMDEGMTFDKVQHPLHDKMTEEIQKRRNMFQHNKIFT